MYNYAQIDVEQCEFFEVAAQEDLPNGERLFIEIDERPIVLLNIAGELFAVGDICTHDDGPVGDGEVEDHVIVCPRHGARFDLRSGKAIALPAFVDIPAYPIKVSGGKIFIGVPK
jgi:3-phenylpropionate/trans-cinnamate dioxygenase ferredoxin subunit